MGKLDGKVAIVTGARGLGRAYAKRLAGLGAKVAVASPPRRWAPRRPRSPGRHLRPASRMWR